MREKCDESQRQSAVAADSAAHRRPVATDGPDDSHDVEEQPPSDRSAAQGWSWANLPSESCLRAVCPGSRIVSDGPRILSLQELEPVNGTEFLKENFQPFRESARTPGALADELETSEEKRRKDLTTDDQQSNRAAECETIVDVLCAHLRRNTHLTADLMWSPRRTQLVNDAIVTSIAWRCAPTHGSWAGQLNHGSPRHH